MMIKKLIEVALPLDAINGEASREKSIRYGHPSTLHLWWARRPLAAARAVIWASLVDDPSSHPELFPSEEAQEKERQRLFKILSDLVVWENSNKPHILEAAKKEMLKYNPQGLPELLDPFSGGGAIPLEAGRLGLVSHAHDLNPVAITINKAMEEIPNRFDFGKPVSPSDIIKEGTTSICLAIDVKHYAKVLRERVWNLVKNDYPSIKQGNSLISPIAWIWAHTIDCPNPVCHQKVPLMRSSYLAKSKSLAWIEPVYPDGKLTFKLHRTGKPTTDGTINRRGAVCPCCGSPIDLDYVRKEGRAGRMGCQLMAIVGESASGRLYFPPDAIHESAASVSMPEDFPNAAITKNPRDFKTPNYGMKDFADLFTPRQMNTLVTFCDELSKLVEEIESDAVKAGMADDGIGLEQGGKGAKAYAQAIKVYLAFVIDKLADYSSKVCSWNATGQKMRNTFGRQAIPMVWDYAEVNIFSHSSGSFDNMLEWVVDVLEQLPSGNEGSEVSQFDAQSDCGLRDIMVSTDPPYYDNIAYADLADYFYIWLRRNLKDVFPRLYSTMLVPKTEELVAMAHRFNGDQEQAKEFFEDGMHQTCRQIYKYTRDDVPVTIYYAYKQSETETDENSLVQTASSGWETMLSAIIESGFMITGTWPMRTEMPNRMVASEANALSSSIVLVCRKRPANASICTRRDFVSALKNELKVALKNLQTSNIAPVDMAQSAIGPGIGVFSRYSKVLEADGRQMSVREALKIINQELDLYFSEQGNSLDAGSRFCVDVFSQYGFNPFKFGDADILARAKNTSVATLEKNGLVSSEKGSVRLLERKELGDFHHTDEEFIWLLTQKLTKALEEGGVKAAAAIVHEANRTFCEHAKELAYRLYSLCERKKWNQEGYAYNSLVMSWNEILAAADDLTGTGHEQLKLF